MEDKTADTHSQNTMLKWILGLVAGGIGAAAVWIGAQISSNSDFTRKLLEKADDERAARVKADIENTKAMHMLATNVAANTDAMKGIGQQSTEMVRYLRDLRNDTKLFPAVREASEPRPEP